MVRPNPLIIGLSVILLIWSCANFRSYFNAYYNANKAYTQAQKNKEKRLKINPQDTVKTSGDEKVLYQRAIEKYSKVLELFKETDSKYLSRSLYMLGMSYYNLQEWENAIKKFNELENSYPNFEELEKSRFYRAVCLFHSATYLVARSEILLQVKRTSHLPYKLELLDMLASLEKTHRSPEDALKQYQELLNYPDLPPNFRGKIYWECAQLSYKLGNFKEAREFAIKPEILKLKTKDKYEAGFLAGRAAYQTNQKSIAIQELALILNNSEFDSLSYTAGIQYSKWLLQENKEDTAFSILKSIVKKFNKTPQSSESYYILGLHSLEQKKERKPALEFFDSSIVQGSFPYADTSRQIKEALEKIAQLQKKDSIPDTTSIFPKEFTIAEVFLFQLNKVDSALYYLNLMLSDSSLKPEVKEKLNYAKAYIYDVFKNDTLTSHQLYREIVEKFPNTETAKQAERNLGLVPQTKTTEDLALQVFREAEDSLLSGYDLNKTVIPKYREVVRQYPKTKVASMAQFIISQLHEKLYFEGDTTQYTNTIVEYKKILKEYKDSQYFPLAKDKLSFISISDTSTAFPTRPPLKMVEKDWELFYTKKDTSASQEPEYQYDEEMESEEVLEKKR